MAIAGERIAPRLLDHYLARTGYEAQQTDEPVAPGRRDDLYGPVPGDHGAHGTFDARAKGRSLDLWMTTHRGLVGAALACAGVAAGAALTRGRW